MEKRIYLLFDKKEIDVVVPNNSEALDRAIRVAIGADPDEGLSLKDKYGNPLLLTPRLLGNTPSHRYHVQRLKPKGMLIDEVHMDLLSLENRVLELEKNLEVNQKALPYVVNELKHDVEKFRHKLETTKHLSWLSCYKELPPSSRKIQYRRRSDAKQKIVREQFLQICEQVITEEVRQCLRLSSFDCMQWSDEEILLLLQFMFIDLDLIDKFNIDMTTLRNFLFQVYKNYNEVPFHNFRHCFCVAQMMYAMAIKADLVKRIGSLEVLILIVSCICHDLDHPGYNNIYQINARTELALRYNDISPLENHHCSIAFRILELEECNIFSCFDYETYKVVREGIIRCILATDMARHNEILAQFREAVFNGFDFSNKAHVNLLCMVLIKVADISNEARPMDVAEPWLDRLLEEFFTQSDAEKEEGLPVTPFMDREKITKPSSQCSFIGFVLLPLFEALGELLAELVPMIVEPVRSALEHYRRLNEAHHKNSTVDGSLPSPTKHLSKSSSICSMRRKLSTSLSNTPEIDIDEPMLDVISSDDEATVNEVAVSERALKFKISTETASIDRKSYPGSRKGSREKYPHDHHFDGEERCESCLLKQNFKDRSLSLIEPDSRHPHRNKPRSSVESPEAIKEFCGMVGEGHDEKIPEETPTKSPNLINRIKTLGGRLSKSIGDSPSKFVPPSPSSLKGQRVSVDRESRASTLPKVSRKRFGSEARKGWRSFLKKRDDGASTKPNGLSQETLDEGETSVNNNRKKKEKGECSSSPSTQRQKWVHNLVSSFRGKKSNTQDATKS